MHQGDFKAAIDCFASVLLRVGCDARKAAFEHVLAFGEFFSLALCNLKLEVQNTEFIISETEKRRTRKSHLQQNN